MAVGSAVRPTKFYLLVLALFACSAPASAPEPLEQSAPPEMRVEHVEEPNKEDAQAMSNAVSSGDLYAVRALLARGVDPTLEIYGEWTLQSAAALDRVAVVEILLNAGAKLDQEDEYGRTALHEAVSGGCFHSASVLLQAGARADRPDLVGLTPLHLAAQADQPHLLDLIMLRSWEVEGGLEMDARTSWGTTPLHEAAASGSTILVERLCSYRDELKCVIDARDQNRRTPLHHSALRGDVASYDALVSNGANADALDAFGFNPRQYLEEAVEGALSPAPESPEQIDLPEAWDGAAPLVSRWQDRPYGGFGDQGLAFAAWSDGVILFASDPSRLRDSVRIGRVSAQSVLEFVEELRGTGLLDLPWKGNHFESNHMPYSELLIRSGECVARHQWVDGRDMLYLQRHGQASMNRSLANSWSRMERAVKRLCSGGSVKFSRGFWSSKFRGFDFESVHPPVWLR